MTKEEEERFDRAVVALDGVVAQTSNLSASYEDGLVARTLYAHVEPGSHAMQELRDRVRALTRRTHLEGQRGRCL